MARKKKEKVSTGKKNQGKRSPTSAVPPDQHQPKDRDPFLLERTRIHKELTKPLTVSYLRKLCHKAANEVLQGNERFRLVQDVEAKKWHNDCDTFEAVFNHEAQPGNQTCARVIDGMFVAMKNNTDAVATMLLKAFEDVQEDDVSGKRATRELTARVASQIPTDFFKLEEAKSDPSSNARYFWDLKNPAEPWLNTSLNTVIFWVMASVILNHPWRANFHDLRNHVEAPHVLDALVPASPASVEKQQSLFSFWTTPKRNTKDSVGNRKEDRSGKSESMSPSSHSSHSSTSSMIEDEEMNAGLPPPGQRIEEAGPRDDDEASFGQNFDGSEEEKGKEEESDDDSDDDDDSMPEAIGTRSKSGRWNKGHREDLSGKSINLETSSAMSTNLILLLRRKGASLPPLPEFVSSPLEASSSSSSLSSVVFVVKKGDEGHKMRCVHIQPNLFVFDASNVDLPKLRMSFTFLNTVEENKTMFKARDVRKADEALKDKFIRLIQNNWIRNCPIMVGDVRRSHAIYGPPLPPIKGRTKDQTLAQIKEYEVMQIPKALYEELQEVTLCVNIT